MSFVDISFGPMNSEFIDAYKKGEIQDGTAWGRWMGEEEIFEREMLLYRENSGGWDAVMYTCDHPKDWEHYWLHAQFEIYLASRGEIALMIERAGYKFCGRNGLTSDTFDLPPGELYGITYWHLRRQREAMRMQSIGRKERSLGCIIGGAMGDAFGNPIEFLAIEGIRERYGADGLQEPILIGGRYRITDDTQMTLLTADGMLFAYTKWCTDAFADLPSRYVYGRYRRWARLQGFGIDGDAESDSWLFDDPAMYAERSPGNTCIRELQRYGEPAKIGSPRNGSKGCGGLMRVAPAGLFCDQRMMSVKWAADIAASTHGHPFGYMTAGMLAAIIHCIMEGEDLRQSISDAGSTCMDYFKDPDMDDLCRIVDRAVELSESSKGDAECMRELGEGWVAEETLAMAVFSCLRHSDDPKQCLRCAVNVTGDSDSIGSVAGNIIGAYLGIDRIREAFDVSKLECIDKMEIIAADLVSGYPEWNDGPADPCWDDKYIHCRNPYREVSNRALPHIWSRFPSKGWCILSFGM